MFLAFIGVLLIIVALVALLSIRAMRRAAEAKRDAIIQAAERDRAEAQAEYDKRKQLLDDFAAWQSLTAKERNEHERSQQFQGLANWQLAQSVDDARYALDHLKTPTFNTEEEASGRAFMTLVAFVALIIGVILIGTQSFYRQDIGEAKVQVSWSGQLAGQTTTPGFHLKAPWVSARTFDVRNNLVTYVGSSEDGKELPNYAGNVTTGPQITFQDKEGVTGNLDLTLRYSIEPGSVLDVYSEFGTQENFVNKVISEGVRAEARVAPSTKGTLEVYSDRAGLSADIMAGLEKRWAGLGIIIEDVAVQEIRYSTDVQARFDDAQAARIAITKAEADQEAATVTARTKVIEAQGVADAAVVAAQGQAEANELLTESLTEQVLQQRWIDALKEGTVYVVPPGSTPFITTK